MGHCDILLSAHQIPCAKERKRNLTERDELQEAENSQSSFKGVSLCDVDFS